MVKPTNPSEIARLTLKQLLARQLQPSPDNYQMVYEEIAGPARKHKKEDFPVKEFKLLVTVLPKDTAAQKGLARKLTHSIQHHDLNEYAKHLADFIADKEKENEAKLAQGWRKLILSVWTQLEEKQAKLPASRKRSSLERVLAMGIDDHVLHERLQNLVKLWSEGTTLDDSSNEGEGDSDETEQIQKESPDVFHASENYGIAAFEGDFFPDLRELLALTIENLIAVHLEDDPDLTGQAYMLAQTIREAKTPKAVADIRTDIKRLAFRMQFLIEDRHELRAALIKILQLLIDNVCELVVDDKWMSGQIGMVRDIIEKPMSLRVVNDAEQRLKEVIFKQSQLKYSLNEAKEAIKQMLAGFVDHLSSFVDTTSDYHNKIETCVTRIGQTENINELESILGEVIRETRSIQLNAQRSRDDLLETKQRVEEAEKKIDKLQNELDQASKLVRYDQLTGTFNRRGLEENFASEIARAERRHSPLCVAMLDIDNFKKLNDSLGHDAGDSALIHLVEVIRDTLRPQDTIARYGGEEFLILLPDTSPEQAEIALTRLQRNLTTRFFLHNNEKILITFSAGLTDYREGDSWVTATKRADEAMYTAKRAGKNRVVVI